MFTTIVFFLVLSILVIIHELGHFIAAKKLGVKVEEFGFGLPPRVFGIRKGETLYSLNWLPFGGFVKVFGEEEAQLEGRQLTEEEKERSFAHKKAWQKSVILVAGVVCNFLLGWVIISYLFTQGVPVPTTNVSVDGIISGSPAEVAGLQKGDVLKTIAYKSNVVVIDDIDDVTKATKEYAGKEITMSIERNGNPVQVKTTPRVNPPKNEGSLGISITNFELKKYSLLEAPWHGLKEAAVMTYVIAKELMVTLVKFVTFQHPQVEVAGPVGIAKLTGEYARLGLAPLLNLIGLLSLNLAVINILPFPSLDGGRLMVVIIEKIRGRKINADFERKMNFVGFAFLISLIILVTIKDIMKLL